MDARMPFLPAAGYPMEVPPSGPQQLFERAEHAFAAGRHAEAASLSRQLIAAQFLPGVQLYRLAMITNRDKDFDAAWRLHRQALEVDPLLASHITHPSSPHHHIVCRPRYETEEVARCPVCDRGEQTPLMVVNCLPFNHYHPSIDPVRRWVRCRECGHGFANPRPAPAALREAFREPPPPHLLQWSYETLMFASDIVHQVWQRRPGGELLDVGAGSGMLAGLAVDYGYRVCALDRHPGYAERLRRVRAEFVLGDICTCDFAGRQFDVVLLGDVLEHVTEPRRALARVSALLKPSGLLWLSTPDHEGVWPRMMGDADPMWFEGEHMQYFSQRSLKHLLAEQGLAVVDYRLSKRFIGCMEVIIERAAGCGLAVS